MQRFPPAVGLLAVVMLVSSVVIAAVEATGEFVPAALRDRPGLARPVPQDAPPEASTCSTNYTADVPGTCVTIRNLTRSTTLQLESFDVRDTSTVEVRPPQSLGPDQSGTWVTRSRESGRDDVGKARYQIVDGPSSVIEYGSAVNTGSLSVVLGGNSNERVPFCEVKGSHPAGERLTRTITYSDFGPVLAIRGICALLLEDETAAPTPTPGASPDTLVPAAAVTPAPVPPDNAAPPSMPGANSTPIVGPTTAPLPLVSPTPAAQPALATPAAVTRFSQSPRG